MRETALLVLALGVLTGGSWSQSLTDDCLTQGGRDPAVAIRFCTTAIESRNLTNYELVHSLNSRGWAYYRLRNYDLAIRDFSQAIQLKADYSSAFNNRGLAYSGKSDYDHAIEDYNRAIELKGDYATALKNRGLAYFGKSDYDTAIQNFNKAINLRPDDAELFYDRGRVYSEERDFNRAIGDFSHALQLKPNYANAFKDRSDAFMYKHDDESAIRDITRVIELEPNDADAVSERGSMYHQKLEYERAIRDFTRAIQLKPEGVFNFWLRAGAYYDKGEYGAAIRDYDEVIKRQPEVNLRNVGEIDERGLAYLYKGDYEGAIRDFDQVAELESWGFRHRGLARFFMGDFGAAKEDFARAGEGPTEDIWMFLTEAKLGESSAQEELLEKVTRIREQLKDWPGAVIQFYLGSMTSPQVIEAARANDLADKNPCCEDSTPKKSHLRYSEGAAYFYLGQSMLLRGDQEQARRLFQKALIMAPKNSEEYHGSVVELRHISARPMRKPVPK